MWPDYEEITDVTEMAEWGVEQVYHVAVWYWLQEITPMVLPTLEGSSAALPPQPEAVTSRRSLAIWNELIEDFVLPALAMTWCYSYLRAVHALRVVVPGLTTGPPVAAAGPPTDINPVDVITVPLNPKVERGPHNLWSEDWEPEVWRGRHPSGTAENWTADFPTWVEHLHSLAIGEDQRDWTREFPNWLDRLAESDIVSESAQLPGHIPEPPSIQITRPYRRGQRNDLVSDLVALAWDTNPDQIKMAAQLVWTKTSNKAKLARFLGVQRDELTNSLPGRLRDLLVGATARRARQAMPMSTVRDELGMWLGTAQEMHGGKPGNSWHVRPLPTREKWLTEADTRVDSWNKFYERDFEPPAPRPAMDFFQRLRDVSAESGYQTAGIINDAVITAASQSDVSFDLVWVAHMDARTRDSHFVADGQRVEMGGYFIVGGHALKYPGDPNGPAAQVRNCRCRVGMVEVGEPMPPEMYRKPYQQREIRRRQQAGLVRAREDPEGIGYITPTEEAEVASAAPSEQETEMTEVTTETYRTFKDAPVAFIGVPTSDNRLLHADIELTFRAMPLPLMWMRQAGEGHLDAFTVGVIESARVEDSQVLVSGYLLNSEEADQAADQLTHGVTRPSVDLASVEWSLTDADGVEITEEDWWGLPMNAQVMRTFTKAELIGTTLVATPAFGDTRLALDDERESREAGLAAAAAEAFAPRVYPASYFVNPNLPGPTLPTMNDEGRVYGHIACWGLCHRSVQTSCVTAPRSPSGYSHFHTSPAVRLDDGNRLAVGRLTVGTGHAPDRLAGIPAQAHYDNTGSCWALVRVGEDAHGIWFSGVTAPWATAEQIEAGLSAPLSGDWRDFGKGLELVAALSVNTPGFAARGRDDDLGRPVALVASLGPAPDVDASTFTLADIKSVVAEALAEQSHLTDHILDRDIALARAAATVGELPTPNEQIAELLAKVGL